MVELGHSAYTQDCHRDKNQLIGGQPGILESAQVHYGRAQFGHIVSTSDLPQPHQQLSAGQSAQVFLGPHPHECAVFANDPSCPDRSNARFPIHTRAVAASTRGGPEPNSAEKAAYCCIAASRRPKTSPNPVSTEVEALACEMRRAHPRWGCPAKRVRVGPDRCERATVAGDGASAVGRMPDCMPAAVCAAAAAMDSIHHQVVTVYDTGVVDASCAFEPAVRVWIVCSILAAVFVSCRAVKDPPRKLLGSLPTQQPPSHAPVTVT